MKKAESQTSNPTNTSTPTPTALRCPRCWRQAGGPSVVHMLNLYERSDDSLAVHLAGQGFDQKMIDAWITNCAFVKKYYGDLYLREDGTPPRLWEAWLWERKPEVFPAGKRLLVKRDV